MARIPIALQLYSLHDLAPRDPAGVLANVAEMGYEGVEFAGFYDLSARDLRNILEGTGLRVAGAHLGLETLLGEELERTVEFNAELGNKWLIVPGMPAEYKETLEGWRRATEVFNEIAERLGHYGMHTGYHNHWSEFEPLEGEIPWQVFFDGTRPEVIMQLDTGNCAHGNSDPLEWLQRYPGRAGTVHLKAYAANVTEEGVVIGEDELDWPVLLDTIEGQGATSWYIVEQEEYPYPALESVRRCVDHLKSLGR